MPLQAPSSHSWLCADLDSGRAQQPVRLRGSIEAALCPGATGTADATETDAGARSRAITS